MADAAYIRLLLVLREGTFTRLRISRTDDRCRLIVEQTTGHEVMPAMDGKPLLFRHGWQLKHWLATVAGMDATDVPVETLKW